MNKQIKKLFSLIFILIIFSSIIPANTSENISQETEKKQIEYIDIDEIINQKTETNQTNNNNITISQEKNNKTNIEETKNITTNNQTNESENKEKTQQETRKNKENNKQIEYIDIDKITNQTNTSKNITTNNQTNQNNESEKKQITHIFYSDSKKSFEIITSKTQIPEITKKEKIINNNLKKVIISSKEHFTEKIKLFTDLEEPTQKQNIKILWENKQKYITDIEYIDTNNDGLINRISWIVPHLSEQIFQIIIENTIQETNQENTIIIKKISPEQNSEQNNPIEFKFNVTYNNSIENLDCKLKINNIEYQTQEKITLSNGSYNWIYNCTDKINQSITNQTQGTFSINEDFSISTDQDLYLYKKFNNKLHKNGQITITSKNPTQIIANIEKIGGEKSQNYSSSPDVTTFNLNINETNTFGYGDYKINVYFNHLEKPIHKTKEFSIAEIDLSHPTQAKTDEEIEISLKINSPMEIRNIMINLGDGSPPNLDYFYQTKTNFDEKIKHTYLNQSKYNIKINFLIENNVFEISSKEKITITSSGDTEKPKITILEPKNRQTLNTTNVNFKFHIYDNMKIEKCNFTIYNATHTSGGITSSEGTPYYKTKIKDPINNHTYEWTVNSAGMPKFYERNYALLVECTDNSSNYNYDIAFFTIDLNRTNITATQQEETDYEQKELVDTLIEKANKFIEKENSWSIEEKKALEDLGIIEEVKYFKRRLLDIEQTLSRNLEFIKDENLREQRKTETIEELENIKQNMPTQFTLIESHEYIKTGQTLTWKDLIETYLEQTSTRTTSSINDLISENTKLQNKITTSTTIKKIKIDYIEESKEKILINKNIKLNNVFDETILEVFPKDIITNEITFITNAREIKENQIYEIDQSSLKNNELIYYIENKNIQLQKLEETDTVLLTIKTDKSSRINLISGFTIFSSETILETNSLFLIIILIITITIITLWILSMIKKSKLKKDPNACTILDLIEEIKKLLKEENINDAREKYNKIKELYPILNTKIKNQLYPTLKKALTAIDRKDIYNLVKEYKQAKNNFQKKEAIEIYQQIKKIYSRLPKIDKEKIIKEIS